MRGAIIEAATSLGNALSAVLEVGAAAAEPNVQGSAVCLQHSLYLCELALALIDKKPEQELEGHEGVRLLFGRLATWASDFRSILDMGRENIQDVVEHLQEACANVEMYHDELQARLENLWGPLRATTFGGYELKAANVMDIAADLNPAAAAAAQQYATHQEELHWVEVPAEPAPPASPAAAGGSVTQPSASSGTWNVLASVGEGSYGFVELVSCRTGDPETGAPPAPVILKRPKEGFLKDLVHEVRHLANARHPHVVRLEGVDGAQGHAVLEYCYLSLSDVLEKETATFLQVLSWFRDVGLGLHFLHSCHHVVHGDVRGPNILTTYEPDGRSVAKLCDFGLAVRCPGGGLGPAPCSRFTNWLWLAPEIQQQLMAIAARRSGEGYDRSNELPQGVLEGLLETQLEKGVWDEEEIVVSPAADMFAFGVEMGWSVRMADLGFTVSKDQILLRVNQIRHVAWRGEFLPPELPSLEQLGEVLSPASEEAAEGFMELMGQCVRQEAFERPSTFQLLQRLAELVVMETAAVAARAGAARLGGAGGQWGGMAGMAEEPVGFAAPVGSGGMLGAHAPAAGGGGGWRPATIAVGGGGGGWGDGASAGGVQGSGWAGLSPTAAAAAYAAAQHPSAFGAYQQQHGSGWRGPSAAASDALGASTYTAAPPPTDSSGGTWLSGYGASGLDSIASDEGMSGGAVGLGGTFGGTYTVSMDADGIQGRGPPATTTASFSGWEHSSVAAAATDAVSSTSYAGPSSNAPMWGQGYSAAPEGFSIAHGFSLPTPSAAAPAFGAGPVYSQGYGTGQYGYGDVHHHQQQQQVQQQYNQLQGSMQGLSLLSQQPPSPGGLSVAPPVDCWNSTASGSSNYEPCGLVNQTSGYTDSIPTEVGQQLQGAKSGVSSIYDVGSCGGYSNTGGGFGRASSTSPAAGDRGGVDGYGGKQYPHEQQQGAYGGQYPHAQAYGGQYPQQQQPPLAGGQQQQYYEPRQAGWT